MCGMLVNQENPVFQFNKNIGFQNLTQDLVVRDRGVINILNRVFNSRGRRYKKAFLNRSAGLGNRLRCGHSGSPGNRCRERRWIYRK
jgi:hypothetical protein